MFTRKAQAIWETAILISAVVAALLAMQVYFKRGLQARYKTTSESPSGGGVYRIGKTTGEKKIASIRYSSVNSNTLTSGGILGGLGVTKETSTLTVKQENIQPEKVKVWEPK